MLTVDRTNISLVVIFLTDGVGAAFVSGTEIQTQTASLMLRPLGPTNTCTFVFFSAHKNCWTSPNFAWALPHAPQRGIL